MPDPSTPDLSTPLADDEAFVLYDDEGFPEMISRSFGMPRHWLNHHASERVRHVRLLAPSSPGAREEATLEAARVLADDAEFVRRLADHPELNEAGASALRRVAAAAIAAASPASPGAPETVEYGQPPRAYNSAAPLASTSPSPGATPVGEREALLSEHYWCGCVREARWTRCERPHHQSLDHDEEPDTRDEEETPGYIEHAEGSCGCDFENGVLCNWRTARVRKRERSLAAPASSGPRVTGRREAVLAAFFKLGEPGTRSLCEAAGLDWHTASTVDIADAVARALADV